MRAMLPHDSAAEQTTLEALVARGIRACAVDVVEARVEHLDLALAFERVRQPHAVGDVTGCVLVEERVEEERPRPADAGLLGDERELAR